jgi:hypothetical protein
MQTFLPYANFQKSARSLDYRRLGKQRVEGMQILNALSPDYDKKGWVNHPATQMWKGYEECLKVYVNTIINEWIDRGYKNTMSMYDVDVAKLQSENAIPTWLGHAELHKSHRINLLRKDYEFYAPIYTQDAHLSTYEIESYPYWWPVENGFTVNSNLFTK